MKWSAVLAVCAAPFALGGILDVDIVGRADGKGKDSKDSVIVGGNVVSTATTEIIIIWVNNGNGAPTETINSQVSASATSAAAAAATHQVTVGGAGGLVYTPDTIQAAVGDMVIFTFMSQNHTVTQSAFDKPCVKLASGSNSGFMPNPNNTIVPAPQMAMQVTVDTPIWLYCAQKGHCGKGMVMSINPTANKTQAMFQSMAIAQNGTGTTAGIVGGSTSAPANVAVSGTATGASASATATSNVVPGTGVINGQGACDCSCLCGVAAFPNAVQGVGAFGGMTGGLPAAMMEKKRR